MLCNYESFEKEYLRAIKNLLSYQPSTVGSLIWSKKCGELSDDYPEWAEIFEEKLVSGEFEAQSA